MASILDHDFGSRLTKFVGKVPKFNFKGYFDKHKVSYETPVSDPNIMLDTLTELSTIIEQSAVAVPVKQAYKVALAISAKYPTDRGMKYVATNLATFPKEIIGYSDIEDLRLACVKQFSDSYANEFFERDIVRLSSHGQIDAEFLAKVATTINSQEDYNHKVVQLDCADSSVLSVDTRDFLLANVYETLKLVDTFPRNEVAQEEHLGYIKNSHKKYMADVYKEIVDANLQYLQEKNAALEIHDDIDFSYYDGETLYYGAETPEYQLLSALDEDAWIEYLDEMAAGGVTVEYDSVDDVFIVESSLYGDVDEEDEDIEASKKSAKAYEVPEEIDYREVTSSIPLRFGPDRVEYQLLNDMSTSEFNKYKEEMAKNGTSVIYDDSLDKFIVQNGVSTEKKANKKAISVVDVRFPIDYNNIIREEAREALDLHWDDSGYWVDSDGKAVTEDELYDIVEKSYYYPSDVVSKTDKEGLSYSKLYRYFNEIAVPKKYKEMEELENLGQQRLPGVANKKAEETKHELVIKSLDDARAECSEGDWYFSRTGPATREELKEEFEKAHDPKYKKALRRKIAVDGYGSRIVQDIVDYYINGYTSKEDGGVSDLIYQTYQKEPGIDYAPELSRLAMDNEMWLNDQDKMTEDGVADFEEQFKEIVGDSPNYSYKKKADIPTPANMPEQELYTRLTNETKDALAKIQSRASELKTLRDEHLQVHGELDEAKNKLAEEKQRISAELSGYLNISGNSFTKICTALSVAETLEAQEEVILNAVTTSIDKVIEANEKAIPEDATNILDILKHMGNVADDIVVEAKNEITKMSEGVNYVRHALRKKQASVDEGKFWPWIQTSIFGAKKFYGFTDRNVDSFVNDYGNLIKILVNY